MTPLLLALAVQAAACANETSARAAVDSGWRAYRGGDATAAAAAFARADSLCGGARGAATGMGFADLRLGRWDDAVTTFRRALRADSGDADAWTGLGLASRRLGRGADAIAAFRRALRIAPDYADAEEALLDLGAAVAPVPRARPDSAAIPARTSGEHFEVRSGLVWSPLYVQGINLGAALPGKFPAAFPSDDATYARWLSLMAGAHANVVRVYTILPPAFYRAFAQWNNDHPNDPLWLVQGVWTELPPHSAYDAPAFRGGFVAELRRAADVVHGRARLPQRPGHAWGRYTADVSAHTLAWLIGREWEPQSLQAYDSLHKNRTRFAGRFLAVDSGTAADIWLAQQCDTLLAYEWDVYHAQRPIAYVTWPTLDPLSHVTEPGREEEQALRRRYGFPPNPRLKEYANDGVTLDAMRVRITSADSAGYFAAYHAYPYYPDFIGLDSAYGPSHYLSYLRALARHHAGRPLLVAEYGVPSSRGNAHLTPESLNHGGHDEEEMAAIDVRLTREIRDAGLAGGIVFAWLDEWFKHNWPVIDLEQPADRTRLWHNMMDAEQHYGLLGEYAGDSGTVPEPGGDPAHWRALTVLARDSGLVLRTGSDASYLYVAIETPWPFDSVRYVLGFDTIDSTQGEHRLPGLAVTSPDGFEFAAVLDDSSHADLRVVPWYDPYLIPRAGMGPTALDAFYHFGATARGAASEGVYDTLFLTTNRWRIARDGRTFPAHGVNRGRLRYGRAAEATLADWYVDRAAGLVELRLAWGLLNVTDPSSRTVLARIAPPDRFTVTRTDGVRIGVAAVRRSDASVRAWLPPGPTYAWPTWETPVWHERLKPAYFALQSLWGTW